MKKNYILLFFALILSGQLAGQYRWEAGAMVGLANYQGDLVEGTLPLFKEGNISFGVAGKYLINYQWAVSAGVLFGKLTGDDYNSAEYFRQKRGVSFENSFSELSIRLEWEPFGERHYLALNEAKAFFSPFLFFGTGFSFTNPQVNTSRTEGPGMFQLIERDLNKNYFKSRIILLTGLGVKYDVNDLWVVGVEAGIRYGFTDYLDGISIAGNMDKRDWYSFAGISLFHRLPGTERAGE